MIRFFSRVRRNLLSKNSISKYLLYGIGEIILVMFGILLALQVNNWNDNRKKANTERQYITNLVKDIHRDQEFYESRNTYLNNFATIQSNCITLIKLQNDSTELLEEKLPIPYSFTSSLAFQSSVVKNNPDFRSYVSAPEIAEKLKEVFFFYEYVDLAFTNYFEMKSEFGQPIEIEFYNSTKKIDSLSTGLRQDHIPDFYYKDYAHIREIPDALGILRSFNRKNSNALEQLSKLQSSLDDLLNLCEEWQNSKL